MCSFRFIIDLGSLADWTVALSTVLLVIVAIFREYFTNFIIKPKPLIEINHKNGEMAIKGNIYYHLTLKNERPWKKIQNAKVYLMNVVKCYPDGKTINYDNHVPWLLSWSPSHDRIMQADVVYEKVFDVFFVWKHKTSGHAALQNQLDQTWLETRKGEVAFYYLKVYADNYKSQKPFILKLDFNGDDDNPIIMTKSSEEEIKNLLNHVE